MSQIEICDGCSAKSPDDQRLFVANHWVEVTVLDRNRSRQSRREWATETLLVCKDCAASKTLEQIYDAAAHGWKLREASNA